MSAAEIDPGLSGADYRRLAEFRYLLRRFLAFSGNAAEAAGLTPQQHQALLSIKGHPLRCWLTVGELAERLCIRHHSAVGLVDRLEARGLVCRRPNDDDHREVWITLTPDAEARLANLTAAHRTELRRMAPLLQTLLAQLSEDDAPSPAATQG